MTSSNATVVEKARVAFVAPYAQHGGSERYLETLLEGLDKTWIAAVVSLEPGPLVERLREAGYGVEVIPTSPRWTGMLASAYKLRGMLKRSGAQLIHANGLKAALVCEVAALGRRLPVVWVKHDFSWDGWVARVAAVRCGLIVGVSEAVTRTFRSTARRKIRVVHNGIEIPEVDRVAGRRALLEATLAPPGSVIIGLVGRLHPVKGHLELIEAIPDVAERVPNLRIAFVGGEDINHERHGTLVEQRALQISPEGAVHFLGHRTDAPLLMSGMDALVMPSVPDERGMGMEAFPLTGLEALAVGTPVIAYEGGGLPELFGPCARFVPLGQRKMLADAIAEVVGDETLRAALSSCGKERVKTHYSAPRMVESMKRCYLEVAGASK